MGIGKELELSNIQIPDIEQTVNTLVNSEERYKNSIKKIELKLDNQLEEYNNQIAQYSQNIGLKLPKILENIIVLEKQICELGDAEYEYLQKESQNKEMFYFRVKSKEEKKFKRRFFKIRVETDEISELGIEMIGKDSPDWKVLFKFNKKDNLLRCMELKYESEFWSPIYYGISTIEFTENYIDRFEKEIKRKGNSKLFQVPIGLNYFPRVLIEMYKEKYKKELKKCITDKKNYSLDITRELKKIKEMEVPNFLTQ